MEQRGGWERSRCGQKKKTGRKERTELRVAGQAQKEGGKEALSTTVVSRPDRGPFRGVVRLSDQVRDGGLRVVGGTVGEKDWKALEAW